MRKHSGAERHNRCLWLRSNLIILGVCVLAVSTLSIGYALLNATLHIGGQAMVKQGDPVRIATVEPASPQPSCGVATYPPTWTNYSFQVDGNLQALDCKLTFDIKVKNETTDIISIIQIIEDSFSNPTNMGYEFSIQPATAQAIISPNSELDFTLTFSYLPIVTTLPSATSFVANFHLVFNKVTPPILAASKPARHFEIFRGDMTFTPATMDGRISALDDIDGDITGAITKVCKKGNANVNCPSDWLPWDAGNYTVTYNVTNSFGLSAAPITMNIEIWKFTKIATGTYHSVAVGSNGSVWTWGWNSNGQRGIGSSTGSAAGFRAPTRVPQDKLGNDRAIDVAASYHSTCAVTKSGAAYCWGYAGYGSLGNGTYTPDKTSPVPVIMPGGGVTFTQISGSEGTGSVAGFSAIGTDGNVYTWGYGGGYRLGTGSTNYEMQPVQITNSGDFVFVAHGSSSGAAINNSGEVYVWGMNGFGQLARGNTTASNSTTSLPQMVNGLPRISTLDVGGYGDYGFTVVVADDGTAWGWGWQYGVNGASGSNWTTPKQFAGLPSLRSVNTGADFTHFITDDNNLYYIGYANYGETFSGSANTTTTPTLSTLANVTNNVEMASGGYDNAFMLDIMGVKVWGIGFSDNPGQEFGSINTDSTSISAVVPWTISAPMEEW